MLLDVHDGPAVDLACPEDGQAGEGRLSLILPEPIPAGEPRFVLLDRLDGKLHHPAAVRQAGGHFLIRDNPSTSCHPDPARPAKITTDHGGRTIRDERGRLGQEGAPRRMSVRRAGKISPQGETLVWILTDLEDETRFPAADLPTASAARWNSETVFPQITDVFSLKKRIGTAPRAALFPLSFCRRLDNAPAVVRSCPASGQHLPCSRLSPAKPFDDVRRQMTALHECLTVPRIVRLPARLPPICRPTCTGDGSRPGQTTGSTPSPARAARRRRKPASAATTPPPTASSTPAPPSPHEPRRP